MAMAAREKTKYFARCGLRLAGRRSDFGCARGCANRTQPANLPLRFSPARQTENQSSYCPLGRRHSSIVRPPNAPLPVMRQTSGPGLAHPRGQFNAPLRPIKIGPIVLSLRALKGRCGRSPPQHPHTNQAKQLKRGCFHRKDRKGGATAGTVQLPRALEARFLASVLEDS